MPSPEKLQIESRTLVATESLSSVLGVVYSHQKTADGGDMYLTSFGLKYADLLDLDQWYEKEWFERRRERLEGTSAVYRIPTKVVNGRNMDLVMKNSRVGEQVPMETHTLLEFINAEFNSPWEEFALVMELSEGKYGPPERSIPTQEPLAIYVPPEKMQLWQSGRSNAKINKIRARHPGIDLDILRQYKLIYGWIKGKDVLQLLMEMGYRDESLKEHLVPLTRKALGDLQMKGYVMADMKPSHIIIGEDDVTQIETIAGSTDEDSRRIKSMIIRELVEMGKFSVIDYELLIRTAEHEQQVVWSRRHSYLDDQRDRFAATSLPPHLTAVEILGVPYIAGHAESTGGLLWVVGRNGRLFDYFLPERWRKTHSWKLSENNDVFYTVTKDNIHLVWKTSRVGETPVSDAEHPYMEKMLEYGFNSPFEAFAIAHFLGANGVGTVYMRAIYATGSVKLEQSTDMRRYDSHRSLRGRDGRPILLEDHNYITLCGYFNGPDDWVARQTGQLCRPVNLDVALAKKHIDAPTRERLYEKVQRDLTNVGYDGCLLKGNDLLLAIDPDTKLLKDKSGEIDVRISNFELIKKI